MFNHSTDQNVSQNTGLTVGQSSGPLSTAHIRPHVSYHAGASILTASKALPCSAVGGGKRGRVEGFTRGARLRLMRTIGAIRTDAPLPDFVTLTYPEQFPSVQQAKRDLKIYLQRLRRAFPQAGYIWKLEPQQRGAPHYHLLVWGCSTGRLLAFTLKAWHEIAGNGDQKHYKFHAGLLPGSKPCVERVRSFRGVWSYASKYLGKTFEVAEWGSAWTGRFWGVGGRECIPFGEYVEVEQPLSVIVRVQRYQRRYAHLKRSRNTATIFCTADQWVEKLGLSASAPPPTARGALKP